ncbi:MAG: shikimate kinase [Thermodesulfobacterium geofontis]|uniref:Shikimate kinase n=1 Tax=Thermodesulfobacterium geofontis TaxID=1295609 RepID=A0A2N7PNH3_9BACT|nr:MAG: shikimate kinase [Thermodesulfobacterium geofontis]PMP98118.1 MAG: shikimate kinase [Thermodesulfobacterium geofontis]
MNKIILIGFRCVGKTTIGKRLAEILNWEFLDLDILIQEKFGKTIKEIVEERGWEYFRKIEKEEMKKFEKLKNAVIALGGGSVIHKEEMEGLLKDSLVVWLYSSPEVILKRMKEDEKTFYQRPALKNLDLEKEINEILEERIPLYERFSHFRLNTDKISIEEAAKKILEKLNKR